MKDEDKTKEQLINELAEMRQRTSELEREETQLTRAEEALRQSVAQWQDTFDAIEVLVMIIDKDFRVVRANQALHKAFAGAKVLGAHCYELLHGTEGPIANCPSCQIFRSGEPVHSELCEQHLGGRWFDVFAYPIKDEHGTVQQVVHIVRDITERKRAEEALQESEARYHALVEQAVDGVMISQDEFFKFTNKGMADITGYTVEEMEGIRLLDMVVPEGRDLVAQRQRLRMADKQPLCGFETKIRCKDGTVKEVEARSRLIQYQGGPASLSIVRDITERKRMEEARAEHAAVVARAAELQQSRQRIVAAQESLRRDIAYQLHGSVQNRLIILLHRLTELECAASPGELAAELGDLRQELVELLESHIRPISHRLYPSILRRGLVPALQSLGDQFEAAIAIKMDLDEELMRQERAGRDLTLEQVRLAAYRIAEEALTNVVKHAKASRATVGLELSSEGWLHLTVWDNGQGFDVGSASGGMGILLMQDYAEAMGGGCVVRSAPGEGTEVTVTLPLAWSGAEYPERASPLE